MGYWVGCHGVGRWQAIDCELNSKLLLITTHSKAYIYRYTSASEAHQLHATILYQPASLMPRPYT